MQKFTLKLTLLCIVFLSPDFSMAQYIEQYKNVQIDGEGNPCEPSIAINPKFPNKIVAGAVLDKLYYSDDFGNTWKAKELRSKYGVFGDPCVIADNEGNFYYFHLSDPEKSGWKSNKILDRIVCQYSANGKSWSRGSSIGYNSPKQQDKEWATYDELTNNIYVTWTQFDKYGSENPQDSSQIMFSYSRDRGKSWTPAIRINHIAGDCEDSDNTVEGATPAVGPRGEVYVAWALNEKIYFDKSADGGLMWMKKDKVIADQPGGWDIRVPGIGRCNGFPVVATDLSYGKNHGNIYVNWSDQRNGENNTDIWFIRSKDGGETWTKAKRVNDDTSGNHQFMSWMTVDPISGHVYIVFYDRRNYSDNQTDVYLAYSQDAGETFTNIKISENPFTPSDNVFFGDYTNISAYAGYVRPIWTRMDNGKTSIWTAIIDLF